MKVVLRTHGGVGNQIFQVLYARLFAAKNNASLSEIHDANYKHRFARSTDLGTSPEPTSAAIKCMSSFRLPKVLQRIGWSNNEQLSLLGTVYLDGYFQSANAYSPFEPAQISAELIRIRQELQILDQKKNGLLVHLRLGDFFDSTDAARKYAMERLRDLRPGSTIITNQEELLAEPDFQSMLSDAGCKLQTTGGFSPEAIIRLMSQFEQIVANDSTLTFWASVLGGCAVEFTNPTLIEANLFFRKCLAPTVLRINGLH